MEKVWHDDQCKLLDQRHDIDLQICKSMCQGTNRCSVIEYNEKLRKCMMRACTYPIGAPSLESENFQGYKILQGNFLFQ